jgi:N-acylneuraminate cytidylyltransferase
MQSTGQKIVAVIPIRGSDDEFKESPVPLLGGRPLVAYTLLAARAATLVDRVIVSTDSEELAEFCRQYGVEVPFIRPASLAMPGATVTDVLLHCVNWLESTGYETDWIVKMEITHPFRASGIVDRLIKTALSQGMDSAFLAYEEVHSYWTVDDTGRPRLVGEEVDLPKRSRRPFYRDSSGLASIVRCGNLKAGRLYGENVGLIPIRDVFAIVDTHEGEAASYRDRPGFLLAELLAPAFNKLSLGLAEARTKQ